MTLIFPESDSYSSEMAETSGFAHTRTISKSLTRAVVEETVEWIRDQRFDAIFYPEVNLHVSLASMCGRVCIFDWPLITPVVNLCAYVCVP